MRVLQKTAIRAVACLLFACQLFAAAAFAPSKEYFVYIGTYTTTHGKGIYTFRFQPETGKVTPVTLAAETSSPAYLVVSANGKFLYAANEHDVKDVPGKANWVTAYSIDPTTGTLTLLNKVSSQGAGPAFVVIDNSGKFLLVANYRGGSVALLPILPDGRLGEATAFDQHHGSGADKVKQPGPHAHGAVFSPDNRFVLVAEHGIDEVMSYRFDPANGSLTPNDPPFLKTTPGAAPRHLAMTPNGKFVYAANELGSSVTAYAYGAADGAIRRIQELPTTPAGFTGTNTTAQLQVDSSGKFLYVSNRGHDSIAVFSIDPSGMLTLLENVSTQGMKPRDFALDPTGKYLFAANQNSDSVALLSVNQKTGRLTPTGAVLEQIPEPTCVVFAPVR